MTEQLNDINKQTHRPRDQALRLLGRIHGEERIVRESGIDMYTLPYLKWITKKAFLYVTGSSAQCYVPGCMRMEFEGEVMHVNI